ncbi:ras-related protein Rab-43-like [Cervus canadensis]|uniref:ras-related protein Rab-43-like n=1 Tax=Cervus canadensis TaxID=1574408 RepID=UPI001CA3431A|nr:ras-related protein Rab-43-like [Cervus canadensis]
MAGPGPGDPDEQYDFLFKLVLVGDASVGKTCVVQRFKTGAFSERQGSTIGVDFTMKTLEIQGQRVKLQIWDTAGQERFRTITQSYYRSANGAILAYDITKRSSFLSVPHWIEDVRKYAGSNIVQLLIERLTQAGEGASRTSPGQQTPQVHPQVPSAVVSALCPCPARSSGADPTHPFQFWVL